MATTDTTTHPSTTGGALGRIEVRSIDYVPEAERHGKVWQQGPFWFLGNFQPFTVAIGLLGPSLLGLSLGWSILAGTLGILVGTLFMAFHASQGPVLGLPQMIQSRAQLGYRGVAIALAGTLFTFVGFNVIDAVIIDAGLNSLYGWSTTLVGLAITVIAAVLAIYGHDWLHRAFRFLLVCSLPLWLILTVAAITGSVDGPGTKDPLGFDLVGFAVMFTAALSYNVTYAPYVSDYSRYLPRSTRPTAIIASVFAGAAGSAIWLIALGAFLASELGATDALVGLHDGAGQVAGWIGDLLVLFAVLALVATMALNAYSGMLTAVTALDSLRPVKPTRALRVWTIVVLAVVWAVVGVFLIDNPGTALNDTLIIMLFLLVPWTAVNLVDFFFVRRGHYAITDLFTPSGIYGSWSRNGLIAYGAGLVCMTPFVVTSFYKGPAASALSEVDISSIIGLAVAGLLYRWLMRDYDVHAEAGAIARSERELEGRSDVDVESGALA